MASVRSNPRLLCVYHALQMSLFPMAILTVFFRQEIGMSMTEIMLVQGAFGLAMALFEFPSGYLADRIGYRNSLMLSALLNALGWSLYCRADTILGIVAAETLLGIGMSMCSGADTALLYESLHEEGEDTEFATWTGRVKFFGQFGEGSAAIVAGFLYAFWNRLPFVMEVGIWLVNLGVAYRLTEPARERPPSGDNWAQVRAMVRRVATGDPRLRSIIALTIALGMSSFLPVWTIQLYATDAGLAAGYLGLLWAGANYCVAIGSLASAPLSDRLGLVRLLWICVGLVTVGYLGMGLTHALAGVFFYYCLTLMRGLFGPVLHHEEQRCLPSSDRAGFVSLRSLLFRSSFLVMGPTVGLCMDRFGQHAVLQALALIMACACVLSLKNFQE